MKHENELVTPYNYKQLYAGASADILEEIYCALGTNVDIDQFVSRAISMGLLGAPWLCQVRRALADGLPRVFTSIQSDRVLIRLRELHNTGRDISRLSSLIPYGYSEKKWLVVTSWILDEVADEVVANAIDGFHKIPENGVILFDTALRSGCPVWELYEDDALTRGKMADAISLMESNRWQTVISVSPLSKWGAPLLHTLATANKALFGKLMECGVSGYSCGELVEVVAEALDLGLEDRYAKQVLSFGSARKERYSVAFAKALVLALKSGWSVDDFFRLSPREDVDVQRLISQKQESFQEGGSQSVSNSPVSMSGRLSRR